MVGRRGYALSMPLHPARLLALVSFSLLTAAEPPSPKAKAPDQIAYLTAEAAGPDFLLQGEFEVKGTGADIIALGIPDEAAYCAAYCARTGRTSMPGYDFYMAFNFFRLAAIFHGIKGRVIRGTAASAQARERVAVLPDLMDLAWQQAVRAGA